jgi:hypothetical protein
MNKLAVILPFWKRPEVTKLCFERLELQRKKFGFDVFVAGDDESIVPRGWSFLNVTNLPLGNKLNTLIACTTDYDGVIIMGSDDFISDSIFELYQTIDCKRLVFYGFDDCHIYDAWTRQLKHGIAWGIENTVGVARLWTKPTLERMDYKLYQTERNSGLDTNSKDNMINNGVEEIRLPYEGHFIVDVKCEDNITHPLIVKTCSIDCDIEILNDIHEGILKLIPKGNAQIKNPIIQPIMRNEKVRVKILKDVAGLKENEERTVTYQQAKDLIKRGLAVSLDETVTVKAIEKEVTEPKKEECTDCDDNKPCTDCENLLHLNQTRKKPLKNNGNRNFNNTNRLCRQVRYQH